jgi:hypothetical protein
MSVASVAPHAMVTRAASAHRDRGRTGGLLPVRRLVVVGRAHIVRDGWRGGRLSKLLACGCQGQPAGQSHLWTTKCPRWGGQCTRDEQIETRHPNPASPVRELFAGGDGVVRVLVLHFGRALLTHVHRYNLRHPTGKSTTHIKCGVGARGSPCRSLGTCRAGISPTRREANSSHRRSAARALSGSMEGDCPRRALRAWRVTRESRGAGKRDRLLTQPG